MLMKNKTLYVTDIDGTLLRSDCTLSEFTSKTIDELITSGMKFACASGRSYYAADMLLSDIRASFPLIVHNGTFIFEKGSKREIFSNGFSPDEAKRIVYTFVGYGVYPLVFADVDGKDLGSYLPEYESEGMRIYHESHPDDPRNAPVDDVAMLLRGNVYHIACFDEKKKLETVYNALKDEFGCILYKDLYSDWPLLEVHPKESSKANAIKRLCKILGCDRVVSFGDGKNDISMFEMSDECYAVANAENDVKAIATNIIESNDCDGVAKWLLENYK